MATHINQVGAIFVPVSDQERSLRFYVDQLGFEKRVDFVYGGGIRWIEVAPPGAANTIALVPLQEGRSAGSDQTHCAFATSDIAADHAALRTRASTSTPRSRARAAAARADRPRRVRPGSGALPVLLPRSGRQSLPGRAARLTRPCRADAPTPGSLGPFVTFLWLGRASGGKSRSAAEVFRRWVPVLCVWWKISGRATGFSTFGTLRATTVVQTRIRRSDVAPRGTSGDHIGPNPTARFGFGPKWSLTRAVVGGPALLTRAIAPASQPIARRGRRCHASPPP